MSDLQRLANRLSGIMETMKDANFSHEELETLETEILVPLDNKVSALEKIQAASQVIGTNPLPADAQTKLGEFLDWLDQHYEIDIGATALYWGLSAEIAQRIKQDE